MFVTHSCAIALLLDKDEVEQPDDADEEPDEEPKKPVDSKPAKTKKSSKNPVGFKA